jgi:cell division protein FtsQ
MNRRRRIDQRDVVRKGGSTIRAVAVALLQALGVVAVTGAVGWGALTGYRWLRGSERFAVRNLAFTGTVHASQEELVRRAGLVAGTNIFQVDLSAAAHAMEADPWVAHVRIARELPDTLRVAVDEHRAALVAEVGELYLVNGDGMPFKRLESADGLDLPVLTGLTREQMAPGQAIPLVQTALEIVAAYEKSGMQERAPLAELHVDAREGESLWTAYCGDEPVQVRLGELGAEGAGEPPDVLRRLVRVWDELERRGARAGSIDIGNRQRPEWVAARLD